MPDTPITWEQFGGAMGVVVSIVLAVLKLWDAIKKANAEQTKAISEKIEESRKQSEDGRRRLYEVVGKFRDEVRENYTPREVHDAHLKRLDHTTEELSRQVVTLSDRMNAQCPALGRAKE